MKKDLEIRTGSHLHMESVVTLRAGENHSTFFSILMFSSIAQGKYYLPYRAGEGLNNVFSTALMIKTRFLPSRTIGI